MPSHVSITDPNIHEPKGVASANANTLYVANGAGSGNWQFLPFGSADYHHSLTGQVITSTYSKIIINKLGALTNENYLPREMRDVDTFWDSVNNKLRPYRLGDTYNVRVTLPVTAEAGAPVEVTLAVDNGTGASPVNILIQKYATTGKTVPYTISWDFSGGIYQQASIDNGINLWVKTNTGTLTLGSPSVFVAKVVDGGF